MKLGVISDAVQCWSCICMLTSGVVCSNPMCCWLSKAWFAQTPQNTLCWKVLRLLHILYQRLYLQFVQQNYQSVWNERRQKDTSLRYKPVTLLWFSLRRLSQRETAGSMWKPPKDTVSSPSRGPRGRTRESTLWWFETLLGKTQRISMWKLSVRQSSPVRSVFIIITM